MGSRLTAKRKKWGRPLCKAASEKFNAVPVYRSTSSTMSENPSQPPVAGSGAQDTVWFWSDIDVFQLVEFVMKEGIAEPDAPSPCNCVNRPSAFVNCRTGNVTYVGCCLQD